MEGPRSPNNALTATPSFTFDHRKSKEKKLGHRRVNDEGEITFKKIQTSQIMGSIQLGIFQSVSSYASKPERDLLMQDFQPVVSTAFPKEGSNLTVAHRFSDFKFKSYAPTAFRYFRDLFGIKADDFMLSLSNNNLRELTNPGASGSIFYLTSDDEFIIKTVQHKEAEFLHKLLPGYYMNLNQNKRTLLPKFYGLFCYQCGGKNVRLIVMNNLLPSSIRLHERYDLKGATYKRKASKVERKKTSPTYKDLDFMERHPDGIFLTHKNYTLLTESIQRDCRVLESFKIMDYSLLVGIHNLDAAKREKVENPLKEEESVASPGPLTSDESDNNLTRSKSFNRQRIAAFSTAMESIAAEASEDDDEDVPPGGIPAKNAKGDNLLLFLGIIDILQSFRFTKKLEHAFKSVLHDGDTVSVHRPSFYAARFLDFMSTKVFKKLPSALKSSPSKRKGSCRRRLFSTDDQTLQTAERTQEEEESAPFPSFPEEVESIKGKDPIPPRVLALRSSHGGKTSSVTFDKNEVVSLSDINVQIEGAAECASETSSSSGIGSTPRTATWTPPHSGEGSTPTHTEGTPSFTESSSSGDAACPTTPVKSLEMLLESPQKETQPT